MQMQHRTVLITGGTSGIGLELARQLIRRPDNTVIVTGRDQARLDEATRRVPGIHALRSDVSSPSAIEALHQEVLGRFPALDTLINNAGIMRNLDLRAPHTLQDLTREVETGLNGPIWMTQQFLPHLRRQKHPLIVNVSSGLAFVPFPASPIYSAAKAALHFYTRCLRAQLARTGVTVVELAPPGTETPLFRAEFQKEMERETGMDVKVLVRRAISGIEADVLEIRPGLSNVLKIASRAAPGFMFNQMLKLGRRGAQAN